jgi:hypothetical protein
MDQSGMLERFLQVLRGTGVPFCVIGGQAVNAYVEPLVSLDLDIAVAAAMLDRVRTELQRHFTVEEFPHSINASSPGSDLRVQLQKDPRYGDFPSRAEKRAVLGLELPVAAVEDVMRGKVWAAGDPGRRPSKRQKDLADISRLLEAYPHLSALVPQRIRERLETA